MAIVNKSYFFTPTVNNERFLSQDEPTEQVMRNLTDSVPFKLEVADTATETQQGLVETATQAEFDSGTDNNANGFALYARPSMIGAALDAITAFFQNLINQITQDITSIENNIVVIEDDLSQLQTTVGENMPIASMLQYPVAVAPNLKWMLCEGQGLDTTTYSDLFAVIGYSFGGAGITFKLPDLRGKFMAGYDAAGAAEYQTIGQGAGANDVTLNAAQSGEPGHTHTANTTGTALSSGAHTHPLEINVRDNGTSGIAGLVGRNSNDGTVSYPNAEADGVQSGGAHTHNLDATTNVDPVAPADAAASHENRPEFVVFPWMIKILN